MLLKIYAGVSPNEMDKFNHNAANWEWDVAAGNLICTEAGCEVRTQEGDCPIYNSEASKMNGMIAGNSILVNKLLGYIK